MKRWIGLVGLSLFLAACSVSLSAGFGVPVTNQTATTTNYQIRLQIGPAIQTSFPTTRLEDVLTGQLNRTLTRHFAVLINETASGNAVTNKGLSLQIENETTGQIYSIPLNEFDSGTPERHFGSNIALAPGRYAVIVNVDTIIHYPLTLACAKPPCHYPVVAPVGPESATFSVTLP